MAQTNDEIINKKFPEARGLITKRTIYLNELMDEARLSALDDCKTLLERVLSETPYYIGSSFDIVRAKAIDDALAELEALRKKVEK